MVLVTHHQLKGSCTTFASRRLPCRLGEQHKAAVGFASKAKSKGVCSHGTRFRPFKITALKGKAQSDKSGRRDNGSSSKNSLKHPHLLEDSDELNMLCTESLSQVTEQIFDGELPQSRELLQTETAQESCENVGTSKSIWNRFLELDAAIKIPITIFIPLYLVVNIVCGPEVSKELTSLWILGPLVVAFYAKVLQGLCKLYVFIFRLAVKLIISLPGHCQVSYSFVFQGKLQRYMWVRLVQPIAGLKDYDYKELSRKEMKRLREWFGEKYLDFVECIWPYYCRTIRFLKQAHFI